MASSYVWAEVLTPLPTTPPAYNPPPTGVYTPPPVPSTYTAPAASSSYTPPPAPTSYPSVGSSFSSPPPSYSVPAPTPPGFNAGHNLAKPSTKKVIRMAVPGNMHADINKGKPLGALAEIVDHLVQQMGHQTTVITMSSGDMKRALKSGDLDIGVGLLVKAEAKNGIAYSKSIVREYNVLIARKNEGLKLTNLAQLKNLKIGARVGFRYPHLEEAEDINLIRQRKDGENVRDLFLGNVDMAVIGSVSDIYEFRGEGIMSSLDLIDQAVGYIDLGAAFSQKSLGDSFSSTFNKQLSTFMGSSQWNRILERNGIQDLVKDWHVVEK